MATGFGIVGCGLISDFHARAIEDVRGAKLVACFDTVAAAAERLAKSTGAAAYDDLDKMLADPAYLQKLVLGIYTGIRSFVANFESTKGFTE